AEKNTTAKPATRSRAKSSDAEPAKAAPAKAPATRRAGGRKAAASKLAEPTIEQATSGEIEVEVKREGDDVVLTVGGKKRSLDDVDDSKFEEAKEAPLEKELVEDEGFALKDSDDADEPEQQVVSAGATAD